MAVQFVMAYHVRTLAWWKVVVLAYTVSGTCNQNLLSAQHEISHFLALKKPYWNKVLAVASNCPIVVPMATKFRQYHQEHHSHLVSTPQITAHCMCLDVCCTTDVLCLVVIICWCVAIWLTCKSWQSQWQSQHIVKHAGLACCLVAWWHDAIHIPRACYPAMILHAYKVQMACKSGDWFNASCIHCCRVLMDGM